MQRVLKIEWIAQDEKMISSKLCEFYGTLTINTEAELKPDVTEQAKTIIISLFEEVC